MTSLFISYSRRDTDCARRLTESFKGQNLDLWIDWESIPPTVDWWSEIQKGIEQADVFLFLVSPASIRSKVCRREIDHAIRNGKRLIPIVVRDVNAEEAPSVLSHLNWIFIRENDDFNSAWGKLDTAIKTDYDWVKAHRELQIEALEWARNKHDKSFLLRGTELQLAEFQLATNSSKEPHPTDLQREYVLQSRKAADKQRRIVIGLGVVVVLALAALAAFGWVMAGLEKNAQATAESNFATAKVAEANAKTNEQEAKKQAAIAQSAQATAVSSELTAVANEQEARKQAKIAFSRQLAAQAQVLRTEQFDLALLLAIEASGGTTDGKLSLSNLLLAEPHLIRIVSNSEDYLGRGESGFITGLALSPDGNQLIAKSDFDAYGFWVFNTRQTQKLNSYLYQDYINAWASYQIQIPPPEPEALLHILEINDPNKTSSAVLNRVAFSSCRTAPSAGEAPGCASLIYILEPGFERLITPLTSCSPNENARDFQIDLEGGMYHIRDLQSAVDQPGDFGLYSVALANKASNNGSKLVGALYDPQTNRLTTAAAVGRFDSELVLIVWDLSDKKPIMELFYPWWEGPAQINFSNTGKEVDVCTNGTGVRVDIAPESWQAQACEMTGRNFTHTEWQQYLSGEEYRIICPQWPAGK